MLLRWRSFSVIRRCRNSAVYGLDSSSACGPCVGGSCTNYRQAKSLGASALPSSNEIRNLSASVPGLCVPIDECIIPGFLQKVIMKPLAPSKNQFPCCKWYSVKRVFSNPDPPHGRRCSVLPWTTKSARCISKGNSAIRGRLNIFHRIANPWWELRKGKPPIPLESDLVNLYDIRLVSLQLCHPPQVGTFNLTRLCRIVVCAKYPQLRNEHGS